VTGPAFLEEQASRTDRQTAALVQRSDAARTAGHADEAERLARAALKRVPNFVPALLALGRALEASGRHADAAAVYAEAARRAPLRSGVARSLRRVWVAPLAGFGVISWIILFAFRVVGQRFDQRTVLVALLASALVLVLGTLLLLRQRRRRFAVLSADDRRILEAYGGRFVAVPSPSGLVTVAVVIVALAGSAVLFAVGTKPSLAMRVGDCFSLTQSEAIQQVSAISCDLPHDTEVYATTENPAVAGAPFPGTIAVRAAAKADCERAYVSFVGEPYTTASRYVIHLLTPEQPYWDAGVRTTWCAVRGVAGQTTGSARNTGR
jgi:hypothetical protein